MTLKSKIRVCGQGHTVYHILDLGDGHGHMIPNHFLKFRAIITYERFICENILNLIFTNKDK